jgi:hypothetical protein
MPVNDDAPVNKIRNRNHPATGDQLPDLDVTTARIIPSKPFGTGAAGASDIIVYNR